MPSRGYKAKRRRAYKRRFRKHALALRSNPNTYYRCKIMCQHGVETGGVSYAFTVSLHFPTYWFDPTNTYTQMPTGSLPNVYPKLLSMFDQYRVRSLTVKIMPSAVNTIAVGLSNAIGDDKTVFHYNDNDDFTNVNMNQVLNFGIAPVNISNGRSFTRKMYPIAKNNLWKNTAKLASGTILPAAGVNNNFEVIGINQYASMKFFISNTTALDQIGRFVAIWDVEFLGLSHT